MLARKAMVGAAVLGLLMLPLSAGAMQGADGETCLDKMVLEMGWDLPGEEAQDPLLAILEEPFLQGGQDLHECTGTIQPGARMTNGCTMNFIFRDAQGLLYLGTAGHCTGGAGATIGVSGVGSNVAEVVYDGCGSSCPVDFALARIHPQYYASVDPTMCHWGGPSGVNSAPAQGQTTHIYGWGNIYGGGPETRPRVGAILGSSNTEVRYMGMAQPGDSGSPVLSGDGQALGVHVRSTLSAGSLRIDPSQKYATRIDASIAAAEAATGLDIELVQGNLPFQLAPDTGLL